MISLVALFNTVQILNYTAIKDRKESIVVARSIILNKDVEVENNFTKYERDISLSGILDRHVVKGPDFSQLHFFKEIDLYFNNSSMKPLYL